MSSLSQYLADHANAGACASAYYDGTHQPSCMLAPGVCSVIAYLIVELKNAEQRERMALQAQPLPAPHYASPPPVPLSPVPASPLPLFNPCESGNDGASGGAGGGGLVSWLNEGVEKRRS